MSHIFILTLISSWIGTPLSMFIGQHYRVFQEPVLIYVLLSISASSPFQILLNESIAANSVCVNNLNLNKIIINIIIIQSIAVLMTMLYTQNLLKNSTLLIAAVILNSATAVIGFWSSKMYYELVLKKKINLFNSFLVGFLPSLTLIFIYLVAYFFIGLNQSAVNFFLISSIVLPAFSVWVLIKNIKSKISSRKKLKEKNMKLNWSFSLFISALFALTFFSASLRASISLANYKYAALIILGLGAIYSIINTFTRIIFFKDPTKNVNQKLIKYLIIFLLILLIIFYINSFIFSDFIAFIFVQSLISYLIQKSRKSVFIKSIK